MSERRYTITIDGEAVPVRVETTGADGYSVRVGDADPELVSVLAEGPTLTVDVGGRVVELAPDGRGGLAARGGIAVGVETSRGAGRGAAAAASSGKVLAPMPGRIVKVLVAEGESVAPGAALVVMEAMKMENEIAAPHAGTVTRVLVRGGETVERDATLVELGTA
jgi:biotin carboxyl carrier protein